MKANHKRLKADLALGVRKLGPVSVALKLDEFPLFDSFFNFSLLDFPDLDNFWDLADFWDLNVSLLFNFPDFLAIFTLSLSIPSPASLSPTFSEVDLFNGAAVFSIEVSGVAILLNAWINCR